MTSRLGWISHELDPRKAILEDCRHRRRLDVA